MSWRFRSCDLNQPFLLAPALQDWLPPTHVAPFIAVAVDELDLTEIFAAYERQDGRGRLAYHPAMLVRVLVYAYAKGITSSRRIEQAIQDDIGFRYLAANQWPDHDTIASFRKRHLAALGGLFVQVLRLCQKAGLVKLGNVCIDGTKILANASGAQSMSFQQLTERERHWQETVARLLAEAQRVDEEEDAQFGAESGHGLPAELADAERQRERIRRAKQELLEEAAKNLEAAKAEEQRVKDERPTRDAPAQERELHRQKRERSKKRLRRARKNAAQPGRSYNLVDPDSRLMHDNGHHRIVQSYNAQVAVDAHAQVIVAAEVTQEVLDRGQLLPMVASVQANVESLPAVVTADAGYWNSVDLQDPALSGLQVLVPPDGREWEELPRNAPRDTTALAMRERLKSAAGRALFRVRKTVVEPVLGQIKQARGIRRFWLRGHDQTNLEWKLICTTHNLLKLFRHRLTVEMPYRTKN
jgi:transposase